MATKMIKLKDLKRNKKFLELRKVNDVFVGRYRQAYREGAIFPLMIVDVKNNEIVSGNHRYAALLAEFGPDHVVKVLHKSYKNEKERLIEFARENASHGNPIGTFTKKLITSELLKMGATPEELSRIWNISVLRLENWMGVDNPHNVVVITGTGKKQKTVVKPIKNKTYILPEDKEITETVYKEHVRADMAVSVYNLCMQLIRHLKQDWINPNERGVLRELNTAIEEYLKEHEERATG